MSNIYCSQCGCKHVVGAKFCSSCGNPLSVLHARTSNNVLSPKNARQNIETNVDEDGIPTTFRKPSRLSYEIENPVNSKFKAEDIFKSQPSNSEDKKRLKLNTYKKLSKEELLNQSLKECAPRQIQDIDET